MSRVESQMGSGQLSHRIEAVKSVKRFGGIEDYDRIVKTLDQTVTENRDKSRIGD